MYTSRKTWLILAINKVKNYHNTRAQLKDSLTISFGRQYWTTASVWLSYSNVHRHHIWPGPVVAWESIPKGKTKCINHDNSNHDNSNHGNNIAGTMMTMREYACSAKNLVLQQPLFQVGLREIVCFDVVLHKAVVCQGPSKKWTKNKTDQQTYSEKHDNVIEYSYVLTIHTHVPNGRHLF